MKRYCGGESAPRGDYLNLSTWEIVRLAGGDRVLPGGSEVRYLKAPAPLVVVLGPLAGLAFIIFLPLVGILGIATFLAYKVGRGVQALGRRALRPTVIGWRPDIAYLTRQARKPEEKEPEEGAGGELAELEEEVKRLREQEKK